MRRMTIATKLLVLGAGPAGYTAAIYAARAALSPVLIEGLQPGGQLTITTDVENWPGDTSVLGPDLMLRMAAQARHVGVDLVADIAVSVDLSARPFVVTIDSGTRYAADSLVIATGAQARWLGLPSETRFRGFGVSACATCDGFFFRGRTVAVVGGGNTAVEEALFLTNFAAKVYLIHRRDTLRADRTNQSRLVANPKIEMIWNAEVGLVEGTDTPLGVTGVELVDTTNGATRRLAVDGLFVAIGHVPATVLFAGAIDMDDEGYIVTAPELDGDVGSGRVRRRRRPRQGLPPGGDRRGHGVHGRARGRAIPRPRWARRAGERRTRAPASRRGGHALGVGRRAGACSSTVEPAAHNGLVGGSNPSGPTRPRREQQALGARPPAGGHARQGDDRGEVVVAHARRRSRRRSARSSSRVTRSTRSATSLDADRAGFDDAVVPAADRRPG